MSTRSNELAIGLRDLLHTSLRQHIDLLRSDLDKLSDAQVLELLRAALDARDRVRSVYGMLIEGIEGSTGHYTAQRLLSDLDGFKPTDRIVLGPDACPIIGALGYAESMVLRLGAARPFHIPSVMQLRSWVEGELRAGKDQKLYIAVGIVPNARVTGLRRLSETQALLETDR